MTAALQVVCGASLPAESLAVLAELRCLPGVTVVRDGGRAWVRWPAGEGRVLDRLLAAPGVEFYARRADSWSRLGSILPVGRLPFDGNAQPLVNVLTPAPVRTVPPTAEVVPPIPLRLVSSEIMHAATAVRCPLADLLAWAERTPAPRLASLAAARCGGEVLLLGPKLPALTAGERFWGGPLFVPLGRRPEPEFPSHAWREVLGLADGEVMLLTAGGAEVIAREAFQRLSRSGLRRAAEARSGGRG